MANKDFRAFNHGTNQIDLRGLNVVQILKPVAIHLKEDGSIEDKESITIVMEDVFFSNFTVGEISLKMLNEGLKDIGYQLVKI